MASYDCPGIEHRITSYLDIVSEHGAHFAESGGKLFFSIADNDIRAVALDVGGNGPGSHMRMETQNAVSHMQ